MARLARVPGSSKTRRDGYEPVDYGASDEEYDLVEQGDGSDGSSRDKWGGNTGDEIEAEQSSDDEPLSGGQDRVKLLPLKKDEESKARGNGPSVAYDHAPTGSSALPPEPFSEENCNVGEAVEKVLQRERERAMLSESFDTDLEDGGSHLILSDDDSDGYGIPGDKGRKKTQNREDRSWKNGLRSILPLKAWWHVFPLAAVGLLVMWLATKGLGWLRSEPARGEYVRTLFPS